MKTNYRVRVMSYAHQIAKNSRLEWANCLKKAWKLYQLVKLMRNGIVKFVFEKIDGSARIAYGTLRNVPAGSSARTNKSGVPNYKTLCFFDVSKSQFRSFKVENFIAVCDYDK